MGEEGAREGVGRGWEEGEREREGRRDGKTEMPGDRRGAEMMGRGARTPASLLLVPTGVEKDWLLGVEAPLLRPRGRNWLKPAGTGHQGTAVPHSGCSSRTQLTRPAAAAAGGRASPRAMLQAPGCAREGELSGACPPRPAHAAPTPWPPPPQTPLPLPLRLLLAAAPGAGAPVGDLG